MENHWMKFVFAALILCVLPSCDQHKGGPTDVVQDFIDSAVSEPGCANEEAQNLVKQIATEQSALLTRIEYQDGGSSSPSPMSCEENSQCREASGKLENVKSSMREAANRCQSIPVEEGNSPDSCPTSDQDFGRENGAMSWGTAIRYERAVWEGGRFPQMYEEYRDSGRRQFMAKEGAAIMDQYEAAKKNLENVQNSISSAYRKNKDEAWNNAKKSLNYSLDNIITTFKDDSLGTYECKSEINATVPGWGSASVQVQYKIETTSEGKLYATVWGL